MANPYNTPLGNALGANPYNTFGANYYNQNAARIQQQFADDQTARVIPYRAPAPVSVPTKTVAPKQSTISRLLFHNPVEHAVGKAGSFVGQEAKGVAATARMMTANATNNPTAFANANKSAIANQQTTNTAANFGKGVVNVTKSLASPLVYAAKQANQNVIQLFNSSKQTGPGLDTLENNANKLIAQNKFNSQTANMIKKTNLSPSAYMYVLKAVNDPSATDKTVQQAIQHAKQSMDISNKKAIGATAQILSYGLGGGEAKNAVQAAKGVSSFIKPVLANAAIGYGGTIASNLQEHPQASFKDLQKGAPLNAAIGGGLTALGPALGKVGEVAKTVSGKDPQVNNLITNTATQKLIQKGQQTADEQRLLSAGRTSLANGGGVIVPKSEQTGAVKLSQSLTTANNKVASIDAKLAAIEKGTVSATPEERLALFKQRQALAGGDLSSLPTSRVSSLGTKVGTPSIEGAATGPRPNSPYTVAADAGKTFENIQLAKKQTVGGWLKNIGNPVSEFGAKGKEALSSFQSKLGELSSALQPVKADAAAREAAFNKMSTAEHLKFINDMQHGVTQSTPELQKLAATYKDFNAQGADVGRQINPNLHEMENYFTQSGLVSKQDASMLAQKWMDKSNTPGSLKERTFPSIQEAVKYANDNGAAIRETNPEKLFMRNHEAVLTAGKLQEFKAAQDAAGIDPAITQKIIDRYSETGLQSNPLFQRYRQGAGSLNNVQLVGGFHFAKSAFEKINNDASTFIHEVTAGHPLLAAGDAAKNILHNAEGFGYLQGRGLAKDVANGVDNQGTRAVQIANFNTSADPRYAVRGITQALKQTQADLTSGKLGTTLKGAALAPTRALFGTINTVMKPLMSHFVVNLKNSAFLNQVEAADHILGKNATQAERAMAYQKAGNTVDGIMGQMNQDNLFWSKTVKDTMGVLMRSPGYNVGTVQQVGGGLKDLVMPHVIQGVKQGSVKAALPDAFQSLLSGKGLTTRSSYAVAMTANTMFLGAAATYMFTGKGPTQLIDYFYPPTGKTDKNGNPERISLPSYSKDVFSFAHNPVQTVTNKLSPAITPVKGLLTNQDFFGNQIRNKDDSIGTQAKQVGGFLAKQALPFSATNANQRVDKGAGTKAQSLLGLGVAPSYISHTPLEQKVQAAIKYAMGTRSLTPEDYAAAQVKTQTAQASGKSQIERDLKLLMTKDRPAVAKILNNASPKEIQSLPPSLLDEIRKNSAYTSMSKTPTTKQATKDASNSLLQKLGGDKQALYNQKKNEIKASAKAKRAKK